MRRIIGVSLAALALGLAACGDGDEQGGTSDAGGGKELSGKIAVLLPDTKSSDRWEKADRRFFKEAFKAAGLSDDEFLISNAQGDPTTQRSQAEQAITEGAKVILLTNLDSGSGAAIIDASKAAGATMIDYDRLTLNGDADYYVSGDATEAGRLQGQGLIDDLDEAGTKSPAIAMLHGAPTDSFATDLKKGYKEVLEPKLDSGEYTLAASVISALQARDLDLIPLTGLDATAQAVQHILAGEQSMTVYFSIKDQATKAANLAVQIARGEEPTGTDTEIDNGTKKVPTIFLKPVTIRKDNIADTVIADEFVSWDDVCIGKYKEFCPPDAQR